MAKKTIIHLSDLQHWTQTKRKQTDQKGGGLTDAQQLSPDGN